MKKNFSLSLDIEVVQLIRDKGINNLSNHINNYLIESVNIVNKKDNEKEKILIEKNIQLAESLQRKDKEIEELKKQLAKHKNKQKGRELVYNFRD